jgi:hypothetical protein
LVPAGVCSATGSATQAQRSRMRVHKPSAPLSPSTAFRAASSVAWPSVH